MVALSRLRGWRRRGEPESPDGAASARVEPPVTLLERVPDALFSLDGDWRFSYLNPAAIDLLGIRREEAIGERLWDRFPDMVGSVFEQEYRSAMMSGNPISFEAGHPPRGTWVKVHAFPTANGLDVHVRDIEPGMRAAEALRRWARVDEVRFRALLEHAADIVALLNADGTVRYVNKAVERVLGYGPETLIGRSVFPLVLPDDLPRLLGLLDRDGDPQVDAILVECRLRHADGTWRDIELTTTSRLDDPGIAGLLVSARDMTWRRQMERELHAREASYEAIVDGSAIGIGMADLDGHLLAANRAMQAFLGYTEQELLGTVLADYADVDDGRHGATSVFDELTSGRHRHYRQHQRFLRRNGETAWGSLTASLIRTPDDQPTSAIVMVEDVTERQRVATELAAARRRLAASREAERLRLARELHDGPVQDLLAVSYELARDGVLANRGQASGNPGALRERSRQQVLDVVRHLRGVVGELRPPGLMEFGLPIALRGFVTELQREESGSRPAIRLEVDDRAATLSQELAHTIFRIVQESLRNALRHADAGEISVELGTENASVDLQVRDDGCGFEVPERLDDFARDGHFGLVGLAERVDLVDGELVVLSSPGQGTMITVRIPTKATRESDERADSRGPRG